jgi:hypothetical protein
MVKEWDFEAGIFFLRNLKKSNNQLCFMFYGHYWPFSVRSMVPPYTKMAKKRH